MQSTIVEYVIAALEDSDIVSDSPIQFEMPRLGQPVAVRGDKKGITIDCWTPVAGRDLRPIDVWVIERGKGTMIESKYQPVFLGEIQLRSSTLYVFYEKTQ